MKIPLVEKLKKSYLVFIAWHILGRKVPPPHIVKQQAIKNYKKKFNTEILIESGTYLGDMVYALRDNFRTVYSIELSDHYYKIALARFKKNKNIKLIKGDSGKKIKEIIEQINQPALFWLDGHYSSGKTAKEDSNTPIIKELTAILKHKIKSHVILIDDARHFTGKNDYPKINYLRKMLKKSNYELKIKDDIIRIVPQV